MQPSAPARGAIRVTFLPEVGRDKQLIRWGLKAGARWPELERRPRHLYPDEAGTHADHDDQAAWDDPDTAAREMEERGFIIDGGWTAVETTRGTSRQTGFTPGARDAGMTAHRGVLHPDEYVDEAALRGMVENELGFTYEQVRSVYRQGPLSSDQRALRGCIDARLLALCRASGEMTLLARALGWEVDTTARDGGPACWTMRQALNRARAAEAVAA